MRMIPIKFNIIMKNESDTKSVNPKMYRSLNLKLNNKFLKSYFSGKIVNDKNVKLSSEVK